MKQIIEIPIPARQQIPATTLRICMVYANEAALSQKPYTLMLPGGPGANHTFYEDYECLQEATNLIFYNPRGCGLSDKSESHYYTMDNYIDDIHVVIKTLNLDKVILLGKSWGAMSALGYTLRYPSDICKLILAAGTPSYHFIETAKSNINARGDEKQIQICNHLWQGTFDSDAQINQYFQIMATAYSWKKRNNQTAESRSPALPFSYEVLNEGFKNKLWQFNYVEKLKDIACPTLILVGEFDWITDPKYSHEMALKIPNSKFQVFNSADHAIETDAPEIYFDAIRQFMI